MKKGVDMKTTQTRKPNSEGNSRAIRRERYSKADVRTGECRESSDISSVTSKRYEDEVTIALSNRVTDDGFSIC